MSSLHELNIIHRDLKPENILFSSGMLKLGNYSHPLDAYADATLRVAFGLPSGCLRVAFGLHSGCLRVAFQTLN